MSTDREKLEKIQEILTAHHHPLMNVRQLIQSILDEDTLIFPNDRTVAVTVETADSITRIIQKFRVEQAFVTSSNVQGKMSIVIEGDVSDVTKRTDGA